MDLSRAPHYFLLKELQAVKQFVALKAYPLRTRELLQLSFHFQRPLATCGSGGKIKPLKKQQRFDALLGGHHLAHNRVAQLHQVAQLTVDRCGNMNALFNCPPCRLSDKLTPSSRLVLTLCPGALGIIAGAAIKQRYPCATIPSYNPYPVGPASYANATF